MLHVLSPKYYLMCDDNGHVEAKTKGVNISSISDDAQKLQDFFIAACSQKDNAI